MSGDMATRSDPRPPELPEPVQRVVLVTGANGFVGSVVCEAFLSAGCRVRAVVQLNTSGGLATSDQLSVIAVRDLADDPLSPEALVGVDTVIHLAARVHVLKEDTPNPLEAFRRTNVRATELLARRAALAGVRRLVYISSIGVNGCASGGVTGFSEIDISRPHDPYSISKAEAETALNCISLETRLEVVVIRPPLIYGPRVRGNFLRLLELVHRGFPFPIVHNRRSLLGVDNLAQFLLLTSWHPAAAGETFLVADSEIVSTSDLVRTLARMMARPCHVVPIPELALRWGGRCFGKRSGMYRAFGSLVIDDKKARRRLEWVPPRSLEDGLRSCVDWYLDARNAGRSHS
jgi:nucleoside-diphosphate-sugar epimerase